MSIPKHLWCEFLLRKIARTRTFTKYLSNNNIGALTDLYHQNLKNFIGIYINFFVNS